LKLPPTNWPTPPPFENLLFENPWALVISLGVVGVAMYMIGAQRGQTRVRRASIVLFALAVIPPVLSAYVETDREAILRRTHEFMGSARHPMNSDTMTEMLSDFATFDERFDAEALRGMIDKAGRVVRIDSYRVTNTMARIDNPRLGSTYAAGVGRLSFLGRPSPFKTQFILKWRKDDDQEWRITEIVQLEINQEPANRYIRMLGRVR
jgi:hypothetical protein